MYLSISTDKPRDGRIAAYLRVSSDKQDSQRQRQAIEQWIGGFGLEISDWFVDDVGHNPRDKPEKRKEFQRLLHAVQAHLYSTVVVESQDRFGVADNHQFGKYVSVLRENGCELWSVAQGNLSSSDDMMVLTTALGTMTSKREQQEKALRNITGKVQRAQRGEYQGGYPPYGFDVVCFDQGNHEKWRVQWVGHFERIKIKPDGNPERFDGKDNFPAKDPTDVLHLRPSNDKKRIETAKIIFDWAATEAISPTQIATRLNKMKVDPIFGPAWNKVKIKALLQHPIYIGYPTWNKRAGSRFYEFVGGQFRKVQAPNGKLSLGRSRQPSDFVQPASPEFPPVIDPTVFGRVQAKLRTNSEGYARPRSPRKPEMWLRNFLICGKCEKPMRAWRAKDWKDCYLCGTYGTYGVENPTGCRCHRVKAEVVEAIVMQHLAELGQKAEFMERVSQGEKITLPLLEEYWGKQSDLVRYYQEMEKFVVEKLGGDGEAEVDMGWSTNGRYGPPVKVTIRGDDIATGDEAVGMEELYDLLFSQHERKVGRRIAAKEKQYDELYEKFKRLTGQRALDKANKELTEIETEIEALKQSVKPLHRLRREVYLETERLRSAVEEAKAAVNTQHHRRKAEALRHVIQKVVCHFRYSDETAANRPKSYLDRVEIFPISGESVTRFPDGNTLGRG